MDEGGFFTIQEVLLEKNCLEWKESNVWTTQECLDALHLLWRFFEGGGSWFREKHLQAEEKQGGGRWWAHGSQSQEGEEESFCGDNSPDLAGAITHFHNAQPHHGHHTISLLCPGGHYTTWLQFRCCSTSLLSLKYCSASLHCLGHCSALDITPLLCTSLDVIPSPSSASDTDPPPCFTGHAAPPSYYIVAISPFSFFTERFIPPLASRLMALLPLILQRASLLPMA